MSCFETTFRVLSNTYFGSKQDAHRKWRLISRLPASVCFSSDHCDWFNYNFKWNLKSPKT